VILVVEKSVKTMDFFSICGIMVIPNFGEDVKWFTKIIIKY